MIGDVDPYQVLITNAGVVGVVLVLILFGILHTKPAVDRERVLADQARARDETELVRRQALIDTLLAVYHHEVLPTLGDYEKRLAPLLERVELLVKHCEQELRIFERSGHAPPENLPRP